MLVADLAKALEVALGGGDVSALAENRLDDDAGGVLASGLLLDQELELLRGKRKRREPNASVSQARTS